MLVISSLSRLTEHAGTVIGTFLVPMFRCPAKHSPHLRDVLARLIACFVPGCLSRWEAIALPNDWSASPTEPPLANRISTNVHHNVKSNDSGDALASSPKPASAER